MDEATGKTKSDKILKRTHAWLFYLAVGGSCAIAAFCLLNMLFMNPLAYRNHTFSYFLRWVVPYVALFGVTAWIVVRVILWGDKFDTRTKIIACVVGIGLLVTLQMYVVVVEYITIHDWDVGMIAEVVQDPTAGDGRYFSYFQNNAFIGIMFRIIWETLKAFGATNYWIAMSIVNTVFVDVALIFAVLIAREIFGGRAAVITFVLSVMLIGFSPWLAVPYSDTISMPFVTATVWCFLRLLRQRTEYARIKWIFITALVFSAGYLLKPLIVVVGVAFLFVGALHLLKNPEKFGRGILGAMCGGCAILAICSLFSLFLRVQNIIPYKTGIEAPLEYTFTIGLAKNNHDAFAHIVSYDAPTAEKRAAYRKFISQRLKEYGVGGYIGLLFWKLRDVSAEGYFGYWGDIQFDGQYFKALCGIWIVVFIGFFGAFACALRSGNAPPKKRGFEFLADDDEATPTRRFEFSAGGNGATTSNRGFDKRLFVCLVPIALLIMLLFVEGRSRYLISYLPIFCMISAWGYMRVREWALRLRGKGR